MVDWLQISQVSGNSGVYTVTVTASSTSELTARTTSLTVTAHAPAGGIWTDKTETVSIRQKGTGELVVTPTVLNFVASGGSATIDITTYLGDWSLTGSDWLSFSQTTGGTGQTTVTVTAPDYSGDRRRIGSISITDGDSTVNVNVNQWGVFSVVPNSFTFPASGGTESFTVTSSRDWSITNAPAWITMSQVSGYNGTYTVTMTADTNTSSARTGSFDVSDGYSTVNCSVSQDARAISVSPDSFTFPYSASNATFSIVSVGNWNISTSDSWLSFSSMSGTGDDVISLSVTENSGMTVRNGSFIVSDGTGSVSCSVSQAKSGETPLNEYLTFQIISGGTIVWGGGTSSKMIYYKLNNGSWTMMNNYPSATTVNVSSGDIIKFRGNHSGIGELGSSATFSASTATFNVYGNIMSLLSASDFESETELTTSYTFACLFTNCKVVSASGLLLPATTLTEGCYYKLFNQCYSLTDIPELPANRLAKYCYRQMFFGCYALTATPTLSANALAYGCYAQMFAYCNSLTTISTLPATTLQDHCYSGMFQHCISLTTPPALPATVAEAYCYYSMFDGCTSLTTAPELPALILNAANHESCYQYMFMDCTSLTTAPALTSTTVSELAYHSMFKGCTSLTTAPALPATEVRLSSYESMFEGCTSLTTAPELPATLLGDSCYKQMFKGCTGLTTGPTILPSTTLSGSSTNGLACYYSMFEDCTSLTTAPELPAAKPLSQSYESMFKGCTSLSYIKCLATNLVASDCTTGWVDGVSSSGTFVKASSMSSWTTGNNGIPNNWTVQDA